MKPILAGTPHPDRVAQCASVQKGYAQIAYYCTIFQVSKGTHKKLTIQEEFPLKYKNYPPSPVIRIAPPFSEQLEKVCFTDTSARREGKVWKYWAVALQIQTEEKIITEREGNAQAGELVAVWSIFQHEATSSSPEAQSSSRIYIYTDSFAVFKGCMEWLSLCDQNGWEVNQIPVWQKDK